MADILNRLLLETKDFDAKLSNSKKSVNDYSSNVSSMAKTVGLGIGKLAGALGLAMGASEAFNRVLNSSQTLGDMTARNMAALKTSVDEFFYSLGSGEFVPFLNGLGDIIDRAKEAHGAIDQLGNTKISHGYFSAENEGNIAKSQYIAKNKFAPQEDRVKAFEDWRVALNSQREINSTLQSDLVKAIVTSVESEIGGDKLKVTMDDVRMALKIDVTNPQKRDELKSKYSADYDEYRKAAKKLDAAYQNFDKNGNVTNDKKGAYRAITREEKANELSKLNEKYREAIVINAMLNKYEDDELTNIASMAIEYQKLDSSLASMSREYNETAMEFNNANKAVKGFVAVASLEGFKVYSGQSSTGNRKGLKPTPPPIGSIAGIDAELAAKNKELINATTAQARIAVQTTINELEAKKISLKIATNKGAFAAEHGNNKFDVSNIKNDFSQYTEIDKRISAKRKELIGATTEDARKAILNTINELEMKKFNIKVSLEKGMKDSGIDPKSKKSISEYMDIDSRIAEQKTLLINATTDEARNAVQTTIDELKARKIELSANIDIKSNMSSELAGVINNDTRNKEGKVVSKGAKGFDLDSIKKLNQIDIKSPIKKEDIDLNKQYAQSLDVISGSFSTMGDMANQFGNDTLAFAMSSIGSIAQMIVQVEALATANGVASAMSLPFPANIAAIATVIATITSIFSSLPKFADGGIIGGSSFSGDNLLARVNSGEMILNQKQQSNLFALLGGSASSNSGNITIGFDKVRGSDIYLSLKNYMKSTGKKL